MMTPELYSSPFARVKKNDPHGQALLCRAIKRGVDVNPFFSIVG